MADSSALPALAALAGSVVGGLTSFATTWLTQQAQSRAQMLDDDRKRRETLYGAFIDDASKLLADAIQHETLELAHLVTIHAGISRMRLISSPDVIAQAEQVALRIVETYLAPNQSTEDLRRAMMADDTSMPVDPLREFSAACRLELRGH